jgi:hypothetical protein
MQLMTCHRQAVSRRLPTAADPVRSHGGLGRPQGRKTGNGARFIQILRFSLPIFNLPTVRHSLLILKSDVLNFVSIFSTRYGFCSNL